MNHEQDLRFPAILMFCGGLIVGAASPALGAEQNPTAQVEEYSVLSPPLTSTLQEESEEEIEEETVAEQVEETQTISITPETQTIIHTPETEEVEVVQRFSLPPQNKDTLLGEYRITAYCPCISCSGQWGDRGAYVKKLTKGKSVAASLPKGTKIKIDGIGEYLVEDTMANWVEPKHGRTIDIYFDTHEEVEKFGKKTRLVWEVKK
ncbi:hypothetical protein FACS189418_8670 [Clostridia bacterium]|nr:hypothetical protein FACS189418_8670 [Clostridia bacterium]